VSLLQHYFGQPGRNGDFNIEALQSKSLFVGVPPESGTTGGVIYRKVTNGKVTVFCIVTDDKSFMKKSARTTPTVHPFAEDGGVQGLTVGGEEVRSGYVAIFSCKAPPGPMIEFYTFDVDSGNGRNLVPYFGSEGQETDRNILSLEDDDLPHIEAIFKVFAAV
jgi:hypothetical protein